jgi:hypothetical protein
MFYHPRDKKAIIIAKHALFWTSLCAMFGLFLFVFLDEVNVPQRVTTIKVDIKNKVNICLPEDEKIFKRSFFNF